MKNSGEPPSKHLWYFSCLSVCLFVLIWQGIVAFGIVPKSMLVAPFDLAVLFFHKLFNANPDGSVLWVHVFTSFQEAMLGYALSILIGLPLGLAMGWFRLVEGLARPIFELMRPIPPVAWIPLTIFWFGIGIPGKVFIVWVGGVVPCVINAYVGVRMTNVTLIQMARTYGASDWHIFTKLCVPSARPMLFNALQISLVTCWTNLVGAELLAADKGLGYLITMGGKLGRPDLALLGIACIGVTGMIINSLIEKAEKRLLRS